MPTLLHAQSDDNYYKTRFTTVERFNSGSDSLGLEDTSLVDFHNYSPIFRNNFGLMDLGNAGTASSPVVFPINYNTGFQLGWNYLDPYLFSKQKNQKYYNTQKPLTSLSYAQGAKELLRLEALHSQNIKPNWNMGIQYNRLKEDGFYLEQKTSLYNARVFNWFHSKDYRYHLLASATFDRVLNEESGGLLSRESFDTLTGPSKQALVRYFGNGQKAVLNRVRVNNYSATQYFRFGKNVYFPTELTDTMNRPIPDTIPTVVPVAQFFLHTEYTGYQNIFSVNDLSGLGFTNFYRDSAATYDSLYQRTGTVSFGFQDGQYHVKRGDSIDIRRKKLNYSLSFTYQYVEVRSKEDNALYNNTSIDAAWGTNPFNPGVRYQFRAEYYQGITGYNAGDRQLRVSTGWKSTNLKLLVSAMHKVFAPDFNQYYYFGNHHFWFNKGFLKQTRDELRLQAEAKAGQQVFGAEITVFQLGNYIYYDSSARPVQSTGSMQVVQASVNTHFKAGVFHLRSRVVFQGGDIAAEIRVPKLLMHHNLYAEGLLFKGGLRGAVGIDLYYSSSFQALVYEAPIRTFRQQNDFAIGNYPYVSVYASGQIKTVTIFFLFQHVSMGLAGKNWHSSPYYPMEPRAFRLGLRWKLYN